MRTCGFVLAMMMVMAPSLAYAQAQRASGKPTVHAATVDPVEVRGDAPTATAAPEHRSLMGMVMDVLIASAEQQSALEKTTLQAKPTNADAARTATTGVAGASLKSTKPAASPNLATREQIAVESEP